MRGLFVIEFSGKRPKIAEDEGMIAPKDIQIIGEELAILWDDGREDFIKMDELRAHSPSAENIGEIDVLGRRHGGDGPKEFPGVEVRGWHYVGAYAVRFDFSDGHNTGLYTYDFLRELGERGQ